MEEQQRCRRCNWQLTSPRELWTPGRDQEDAQLMKEQRREFVLGAAAAANAGGSFDQALFTRLTQGLSDWGVNYGELYSIRQEFEGRFYQFLNECEQHKATLVELIETARRQHSTLVFADATAEGVGLGVLDPNQPASQAWQHRDFRDWSEFLNEVPASSPERALTLAAGMAPALDQLPYRLIDYVDRQLAEWGISEGQAVCVCCNLAGWAAVEQFLTAVARPGREVIRLSYRAVALREADGLDESPAAEAGFDEWVANALKQTVRMIPLALLTAQVDPSSGTVSLVPRVIFDEDAGANPGCSSQMTFKTIRASAAFWRW
jgi:hypothetical protein